MFSDDLIHLTEPVFRPPSEANSLILQVTNGCSWNKCSFCEMYTAPQKKFSVKAEDEAVAEIRRCGETGIAFRRVFLGDGDAMALSVRRLVSILEAIKTYLPSVTRVSAYCLPRNFQKKTVEELKQLRELGLKIVYVGAETGDDELLKKINKSETHDTTLDALLKTKAAGIKTSMMIINGLGGKHYSERHALESARLVNEAQPDYLATLVLFHPKGPERFLESFGDDYEPLDSVELCKEMESFIGAMELKETIFRSDHASNHLVLKGVLGKDKARMLEQIQQATAHFTGHEKYRPLHY